MSAVRRYDVLDTPPDGAFERITALAARLFDVPISIVSIVDTDRIWFKSHHGLEATEIDRTEGLCASAILHEQPWVLTNALTDPRSLANPLVAGDFGLRFYAGVPLTTHDGFNLGTLCVIDKLPREMTEDELATLSDLAALVMDELELRLSARRTIALETELRRAAEDKANTMRANKQRTAKLERVQRALLEHIPEGVVMSGPDESGPDERVLAHNQAAEVLFGLEPGQLLDPGQMAPLRKRLLDADGNPWGDRPTPPILTLRTGVPQKNQILGVALTHGAPRWLSLSTAAHKNRKGEVDYVVTSMADVTTRHAATLERSRERMDSREQISSILASGAVKMVFQPIVALDHDTYRIVGAEALARFPGPSTKTPDMWFAEATAAGLGAELEVAAVRAALSELHRLPPELYVSVNISPASVTSPELRALLTGMPTGRKVVLELTEHSLVTNYEELDEALAGLRKAGVLVAVDDAGAGFSSLQHILNLRPDVIKLDKGLTHGIDSDPARRALASSMLRFGSEISADIVAEGIETEAELITLRALGIRYGQGYLLGQQSALPLSPLGSSPTLRRLVH
ncbi:hypothetical protein BH20ACT6_BH20ACT6_07620 [soil metagenome]